MHTKMVILSTETSTTTTTAAATNYSIGPKTVAEINSSACSTNTNGDGPLRFPPLGKSCYNVNNSEKNKNVDITFPFPRNSTIITSPPGPCTSANIGTVVSMTVTASNAGGNPAPGTATENEGNGKVAADACDINSNSKSNDNDDGAHNSTTFTPTSAPLNEKIKDTGEDINVSTSTQNISNGKEEPSTSTSTGTVTESALRNGDGEAEDGDLQTTTITTTQLNAPAEVAVEAVTVEGDTYGENIAVSAPMIRLPDNLECLIRADNFPSQRHRWNTNEEIAAILISFKRHPEWLSKEVRIRPKSGSVLLYSRKKVRYRRDGYCWKKRKDGKTTREDHMKLKVQGTECIYGCYVHSAILPTFHRRCYWLLQNPDIVLVHYLNVPYPDDNKLIITSNVSLWGDKKEWTKEELISQLKPMFFSEEEPDLNNKLEISTAETVEAIVVQLMEKQRLARQSLLLDGAAAGTVTNGTVAAIGSSTSTGGSRVSAASRAAASNNNANNATNTILNDILASAAAAAAASALSATASTTAGQSRVSSTSSTSLSPGSSTSSSPLLNGLVTVTVSGGGSSAAAAARSSKPPLTIHLPTHLTSASSSDSSPSSAGVPPLITTSSSSSSSSAVPSITTNHTIMTIPTHSIKLENPSSMNMNLNTNPNASGTNEHGQGHAQRAGAGHSRPPFVLNLSQLQTAGGGLIILNGRPATNATNTVPVTTTQLRSSDGPSATVMDVQNANTSANNAIREIGIVPSTGTSSPASTAATSNANFTAANSNNQTLYIHHHPQQQPRFMSSILTTAAVSSVIAAGAASSSAGGNGRSIFTQQQQSATSRSTTHASSSTANHQHLIPMPDTSSNSSSTSSVFKSDHTDSILLSDHSQYNNSSPSPPPGLLLQQSQQAAFYAQETLDMSHEDIQQTLSANMSHMVDSAVDLEPMSPSADDVFINLDAFDILADLSDDLDTQPHQVHSTSGHSASSTTNAHVNHLLNHNHPQLQNTINLIGSNDKNTIVDINPEWAYSEGGTKILIVGQFNNPDWDYIVHFGDFPVPAVYVQTGVLKCFCPPHSPGLVPIRVYSNGKQISTNSMVFEYKVDLKVNLVQVPPSETSLKLCLIHRMECVESCFRNFKSDLFGVKSLEDCVVKLCCEMMTQEWCPSADASTPGSLQVLPSPDRGLTLLHLAAALGYTRFLFTLIQWKRENPAPVLELEVCPLRTDDFGLNPLMWCARYGHLECGIILAQWSPESLTKRDPKGRSPAQIANSRGQSKLATELEKIQMSRLNCTSNTNISGAADGLNGGNGRGFSGSHHHELDSANGDSGFSFTNMERFHRSMSSVSEDFGLKDCFFGQPDATLALLPSEEESRVLTLAEQIIAAMPERIKKESYEEMSPGESLDSSSMISSDQSDQNDLSFELSDRNYRYYDSGTPSSLSPSSSCLQSPCSSSFTVDSPQPTTADFCEFLQASSFEKDFSNLTLSDREQRELYEAAKVIQKAYRSYKGRKKMEEEKEKLAAIIIQNYYRRYKQYAYLRQITDAALVIQNQYRNYCENKRFKKSQDSDSGFLQPSSTSQAAMRALSQRKQNQAAKKIQQFMRQSKNKLQKERAEKEKQQCL